MDDLRREEQIAEHPLMKMCYNFVKLEMEVKALRAGQAETHRQVEGLSTLREDEEKFAPVIAWLVRQGVRLPKSKPKTNFSDDEPLYSRIGREVAAIARGFGYNVDKYELRKPFGAKHAAIHYPIEVLEEVGWIWIEKYRRHPDREGWFRNVRNVR